MKKGTYKGHILLDEMKDQLKHGCYMSEISQLLGIPYNTIKYHLDSKYRKYILEYKNKKYKDKKNEKRI